MYTTKFGNGCQSVSIKERKVKIVLSARAADWAADEAGVQRAF